MTGSNAVAQKLIDRIIIKLQPPLHWGSVSSLPGRKIRPPFIEVGKHLETLFRKEGKIFFITMVKIYSVMGWLIFGLPLHPVGSELPGDHLHLRVNHRQCSAPLPSLVDRAPFTRGSLLQHHPREKSCRKPLTLFSPSSLNPSSNGITPQRLLPLFYGGFSQSPMVKVSGVIP